MHSRSPKSKAGKAVNVPASLYKSLRPFLKKFRRRLRKRVRSLSKYNKLKKNNFVVKFIHEDNTEIVLPSLSIIDILLGKSTAVTRNKGAEKLILSDQPVISFEQHISKEDVGAVSEFLKSFDYRVFMLNEVLPGCECLIFAKLVLLH